MTGNKTTEIYISLLEEGTPTLRPTQAIPLGDDLYKVLPTSHYNPDSEVWEFPPGSIVRCKETMSSYLGREILLAVEKAG